MYKRNYGPADEEEWDIDVFWRCSNLCVDDTWKYTDVLDKLPALPVDDIDDVKTKKRGGTPPSDSDDVGWTRHLYRRQRHLTSRFDVPTKAEKEASRQLRQNLPVDELNLPVLTGLPVLPDTAFDLEE